MHCVGETKADVKTAKKVVMKNLSLVGVATNVEFYLRAKRQKTEIATLKNDVQWLVCQVHILTKKTLGQPVIVKKKSVKKPGNGAS